MYRLIALLVFSMVISLAFIADAKKPDKDTPGLDSFDLTECSLGCNTDLEQCDKDCKGDAGCESQCNVAQLFCGCECVDSKRKDCATQCDNDDDQGICEQECIKGPCEESCRKVLGNVPNNDANIQECFISCTSPTMGNCGTLLNCGEECQLRFDKCIAEGNSEDKCAEDLDKCKIACLEKLS